MRLAFALIVLLPAFAASRSRAVEAPHDRTTGWFPFNISALESSPTPIDLSWLNEKPAGASGFLRAEGDHIVDGKGNRVRLFGTNFCFGANFPSGEVAPRIAAHLAKNGVNVVRLHHMDSAGQESLIEDNAATKLNAANLARLDRLVAELIAHGVFVNLNLHVSREYPGTPKDAPRMSKGLDYFHPPFIGMFQTYARQLLDHVNPHTGRAYKDEPGIAVIEMNNENSIVLNPWWLAAMPEPFAGELRDLFANHLRHGYADTAALRAAWGLNDGRTGPDLIKDGNFSELTKGWQTEAAAGAEAEYSTLPNGEKGIRWTGTRSGSLEWSLQFSRPGLALEGKQAYRLSFRARSAQSARLGVNVSNSAPPWANLGLRDEVKLKPEWQEFRFEFAPHDVLPDGRNRVVFSLLNKVTSVDLAGVKLQTVSTGFLRPEETLEAGNIRLPDRSANPAVRRDFFSFLIQLEVDHASAMKKFLREEIGARQMITHSALLFGGIVGARREFLVSDIVDTHGYWHHPRFPNKSWDMSDWEIENVSQVADAAGGTLAEMAMQRPIGKPYSVSEYDTPAPNDYAAETFPLFAAMGCIQDWSALYHFAFNHDSNFGSDKISSFFNADGHPAKQAFMPLAALVFRMGLIEPLSSQRSLPLDRGIIEEFAARKGGDVWGGWRDMWAAQEQTGSLAWRQKVGFAIDGYAAKNMNEDRDSSHVTGLWRSEKPIIVLASRSAALLSCRFGGDDGLDLAATLGIKPDANSSAQFGTFFLAAMDGLHISKSRKLWLCALSRAENQGMGWDAARRTVGNKWGQGPAVVLGVSAKVTLPGAATWKIEALDPTGAPKSVVAENVREFEISPEQKTVWWLITR